VIPVLVETNWVVDVCAPAARRQPAALELLRRAEAGDIELYTPHIAFREAASVIRRKHQPTQARVIQSFRRWAEREGHIDEQLSEAGNELLQLFVNMTSAELDQLEARLEEVRELVNAYALTDAMLEQALTLRTRVPDLGPFDEAILAAIVVKAQELTLDRDLSPVDKRGNRKPELFTVYEEVGLVVRTDFKLPPS
jgi:predicted nucleic acid-binding protein